MSGLCSVLDSLRKSLDSESESENDLDLDGNSSNNSQVPSWQGSLQQLPTTPSTSESDAGNLSSESYLCRQCGRAKRKERDRISGCSSLPTGRKRGPRTKKRAHFATDADNSSDPERLSDSHESTLFKPIAAPSPTFMSAPLCSLSPREIKSVGFTESRTAAATSLGLPRPPEVGRGRKPFKANHELFKLPPSGLPSSARHKSREGSGTSSRPALPPRQPLKSALRSQRRNSVSNNEDVRDVISASDSIHRHIRSASATRDVDRSFGDKKTNAEFYSLRDQSENNVSDRIAPNELVFHGNISTNNDGDSNQFSSSSAQSVQQQKPHQEPPKYEEAIKRISLLRWASLQKLPSQFEDIGDSNFTNRNPSLPCQNGYVGRTVRRIEQQGLSFSSNSSVDHGSLSHISSANDASRSNSTNYHERPSDMRSEVGSGCDLEETCRSVAGYNLIARRREDSNESDDVFFNDDSKDHFADESSSSPARIEEMPRVRMPSRRASSHSRTRSANGKLSDNDGNNKRIIVEVLV